MQEGLERREEMDRFLTAFLKDEELRNTIAKKIHENGFGKMLMRIQFQVRLKMRWLAKLQS